MYWVILCVIPVVLIAIDQLTKLAAMQFLMDAPAVPIWNGVLELTFVKNFGISWGMLQNQRWVVGVLTAIMLAFVLVVLLSRRLAHSRVGTLGLLMIFSGGIGNLIDRMVNGYVVDFIHYYKWFDFPVFNFADCCVTIGAVLIFVYAFFFIDRSKQSCIKEEAADGTVSCEDNDGADR